MHGLQSQFVILDLLLSNWTWLSACGFTRWLRLTGVSHFGMLVGGLETVLDFDTVHLPCDVGLKLVFVVKQASRYIDIVTKIGERPSCHKCQTGVSESDSIVLLGLVEWIVVVQVVLLTCITFSLVDLCRVTRIKGWLFVYRFQNFILKIHMVFWLQYRNQLIDTRETKTICLSKSAWKNDMCQVCKFFLVLTFL